MITTTRINVTISKAVLAKLDVYCKEMGVSRSAALSTLAMQALKGYEGLEAIAQIAQAATVKAPEL